MIDFLIVGQGLCGTFLSYYLTKAGKKVLVIDEAKTNTASKVASGVINPVTGRRIVRTWRIEELLPFAEGAYKELEEKLGLKLLRNCSVLDFHPTLQMKEAFDKRVEEETEFLHVHKNDKWKEYFNYHYGVGEINPCLFVDLNTMIQGWRQQLIKQQSLLEERFDVAELIVAESHVEYKEIKAGKIIFCDGVAGIDNPFFKNLPYAPNKGEALIVRIPGLPANNIYKQGISIVPWNEDRFWVGSSYQWNFEDDLPTETFRLKMAEQIKFWLKVPFTIEDHLSSVRPANIERRPFVGVHPAHITVGIFNGMGTKGCSLAPFFAKQFSDNLTKGTPIYPDADVKRFEKALARKIN